MLETILGPSHRRSAALYRHGERGARLWRRRDSTARADTGTNERPNWHSDTDANAGANWDTDTDTHPYAYHDTRKRARVKERKRYHIMSGVLNFNFLVVLNLLVILIWPASGRYTEERGSMMSMIMLILTIIAVVLDIVFLVIQLVH